MAKLEVKGLKEAADNLKKLDKDMQGKIGRAALRDLGWQLAKPMRSATYTTGFKRITGAIQKGLSVAVLKEPDNNQLRGYVVEYPQGITGPETPFAALIRKRRGAGAGRRKRSVSIAKSTAYWWRYMEFGTGPRHASATPKFLRRGAARTARQKKSVARWASSPSRGGVPSHSWIRPIFNSQMAPAIEKFRDLIKKLIDAAVSDMPKR
jgi:hypothetical protein